MSKGRDIGCTCMIATYGMEETRVTDHYCPQHGVGPQREVERLRAELAAAKREAFSRKEYIRCLDEAVKKDNQDIADLTKRIEEARELLENSCDDQPSVRKWLKGRP